jgi:hypothetical protein
MKVQGEVEPTPPTRNVTEAEGRAIGLYAVAARDFSDFIDMLREEKTTGEALWLLREMCATPGGPETRDVELDALMLPIIEREIARRKNEP